eukprot:TRINITY_DN8842_c0_g1_i1.p1 TRINITY_DN8842_c0_g1~~TRINITY_DN8842_c0_g1_i1.p1  ORF type:complete len:527 (+),score=137.99 TRINITY_DN8842_c0_g1_i1:31-1581(+)
MAVSFAAVSDNDIISALKGEGGFDALILVGESFDSVADVSPDLATDVRRIAASDARVGKAVLLHVSAFAPAGRLILAASGRLDRPIDDVRRIFDAVMTAAQIALDSGSRKPLIWAPRAGGLKMPMYTNATSVAGLAAATASYAPVAVRDRVVRFELVGLVGSAEEVRVVQAMEAGLLVARDVGGGDPEEMSPPMMAKYLTQAFAGTAVAVSVEADPAVIEREYPLAAAVGRASQHVERHRPTIVRLEYAVGAPSATLFFAGKGISFDTGGVNLKTPVGMPGMSRDKTGAAAIAGFFKTLEQLQVRNIRAVAYLACVRNSIGSDAYLVDEVITARSGVRVLIGNTDAEGRMVLGDMLAKCREEADGVTGDKFIVSVASLTGHAAVAMGPYSAALNVNATAQRMQVSELLQRSGLVWADPFEVSHVRREDFELSGSRGKGNDVHQCNISALGSVGTARGHQFPAAFLSTVSKLTDSDSSFVHIDMAGRMTFKGFDNQCGTFTGATMCALVDLFALPRI